MNTRRKRRLLRAFLQLVEDGELEQPYWDELCDKLETQANKGDRDIIEILQKMRSIFETSQIRQGKMKAVIIVLEEFIVKVIAETIRRSMRGY